jgi:hypothetical protein
MKAFWNDCGRGLEGNEPVEVDLHGARLIWSDEVRGVEGNFLGLVDDAGRTVQFYFETGIPDHVDDARHLRIVLIDFPQPERKGSYSALVRNGEVDGLIEKAFRVGADYRQFEGLTFTHWQES